MMRARVSRPPFGLGDGDRQRLSAWLSSSSVRAGLPQRARIVLPTPPVICRRTGELATRPVACLIRRSEPTAAVDGVRALAQPPICGQAKTATESLQSSLAR
jgi:hypothetical protein